MIYFALIGDDDRARIKIGYSAKPEQRMVGLRSQFREAATLLAVMDGDLREEEMILAKFEAHRVLGENELFHQCVEIYDFMEPHLTPTIYQHWKLNRTGRGDRFIRQTKPKQ